MSNYGTIKVPRDVYEQHNERRKELGLSWAEYLDQEAVEVVDGVDYAEIEDRIERVMERVIQ